MTARPQARIATGADRPCCLCRHLRTGGQERCARHGLPAVLARLRGACGPAGVDFEPGGESLKNGKSRSIQPFSSL
jgi:hypothetical protein